MRHAISVIRSIRLSSEARYVISVLLNDGVSFSLIALMGALSFESLLPGTVSVRYAVVFFVFGSMLALLTKRSLDATAISPLRSHEKASAKEHATFIFFLLWASFLFGNALFGFPGKLVVILLPITASLFFLLFRIAFRGV